MKVEDVFTQNRRLCVRLHEKGGKDHAMPCHYNLEQALTAYMEGSGLADDPKGPLFRTIGRGTGQLSRSSLPQANAYQMIPRRAKAAGIKTKFGNHSFRPTRYHGLSQERRDAGEGRVYGQPCQHPDDAALRPEARRDEPR
jgi:site-specific recombinase XerD